MKQDRFLLSILIGTGLLVVAALALFFFRQGRQAYGPEDNPRDIVRNYILALYVEDYPRAYGYLQEGAGKPDYDAFQEAFLLRSLDISGVAAQVGSHRQDGESAVVDLTLVHTGGGPFGDIRREPAQASVTQNAGEWKISAMPYPYWGWDWYPEQRTRNATNSGP